MPTTESPLVDSGEPQGDKAVCKGPTCHATIWWQITAKGKRTPVNRDGSPHWKDCPDREQFKRRPK